MLKTVRQYGHLFIAVGVALICYILGLKFLLPLILLSLITIYLPMPKSFNSWLSRGVVALLFLFALIPLSALIQFIIYPKGRFNFIAILLTLFTTSLVVLFGKPRPQKLRIVSAKDRWALLGCIFFILPFTPIFTGNNSIGRIAKIGSVQVSDSVAHYGSITGYSNLQNLNYSVGKYYPSGFQMSASFIEDSILGTVTNYSWKINTIIYFMQYIFLGILLAYTLIYFSYHLLELYGIGEVNKLYIGGAALISGAAVTLMHLFAFMHYGALNYYYICATILVSSTYLLSSKTVFRPKESTNTANYIWPITAYLFLSFGFLMSYPLLTPAVLLAPILFVLMGAQYFKNNPLDSLKKHLPILIVGFLCLVPLLMQAHYQPTSGDLLNAYGAWLYLNILFFIIGIITLAITAYKNWGDIARPFTFTVLPYVLLTLGLMSLQFFKLGELRYYAIKNAVILEVIVIPVLVTSLLKWFKTNTTDSVVAITWTVVVVFAIIIGTTALMPQPFQEIRGLFRDSSHLGKPAFLDSDVSLVTTLGTHNEIQDFNFTILHYDPIYNHLFAHSETMLWGQAMTKYYQDTARQITGSVNPTCYGKQASILSYPTYNPGEQDQLRLSVKDCIKLAHQNNQRYYIVTDANSASYIKGTFPGATLVY